MRSEVDELVKQLVDQLTGLENHLPLGSPPETCDLLVGQGMTNSTQADFSWDNRGQ